MASIFHILDSFDSYVEPETIRDLYPALSNRDFNKLMAVLSIKFSNYPFENFYVFENVTLAINNIVPNISMVEGSLPKWIWYSVNTMSRLRPEMEYSDEIIEYIKRVFADSGAYLYPKELKIDNPILEQAEKVLENITQLPLKDDSFINRQAVLLLTLNLYTNTLTNAN